MEKMERAGTTPHHNKQEEQHDYGTTLIQNSSPEFDPEEASPLVPNSSPDSRPTALLIESLTESQRKELVEGTWEDLED